MVKSKQLYLDSLNRRQRKEFHQNNVQQPEQYHVNSKSHELAYKKLEKDIERAVDYIADGQ